MLPVAIVSMLREVIVRGVLEVPWPQLIATGFLLMVMALLLVVRIWLPPTFEGIDPEERIARRRDDRRLSHDDRQPQEIH